MHPNGDLESTRVHEHTSTRASDLQSCVRITAPVAYLSSRPAMCICGVRRMKVSCRDHSRYSIISHHHHHELYRMLSLARTHRQQIEDGARAVLANVRARVSRRLVQQERHTTHTRCVSISGDVLAAVAGLGGALDHAPGVEERQRRSSYADARRSIQARRHWSSLDLRALAVVTRMKHRDVVESNPFLH